jgi:hypothetical protein
MPDQSFRKHFMQLRKLALVFIAGAAILAFFAFDLGQYLNLQTLKDQQAAISQFHEDKPLLSVAIYFVAYVLMAALSLPGAALLTLARGRGVRGTLGHLDRLLRLHHRRHAGFPDVALFAARLGGKTLRPAPGGD